MPDLPCGVLENATAGREMTHIDAWRESVQHNSVVQTSNVWPRQFIFSICKHRTTLEKGFLLKGTWPLPQEGFRWLRKGAQESGGLRWSLVLQISKDHQAISCFLSQPSRWTNRWVRLSRPSLTLCVLCVVWRDKCQGACVDVRGQPARVSSHLHHASTRDWIRLAGWVTLHLCHLTCLVSVFEVQISPPIFFSFTLWCTLLSVWLLTSYQHHSPKCLSCLFPQCLCITCSEATNPSSQYNQYISSQVLSPNTRATVLK